MGNILMTIKSKFLILLDDLQKAKQKLKQAESTSDIQSEVEITKKRKRLAPRKLYEDSSSEGEQDSELISLPRIYL